MSSPTQKSNSPQHSNESALILEHLELLLALHEEQGDSRPDGIEKLLDAKATEIAKAVDSQIEGRFENLELRIETISTSIMAQNVAFESLSNSTESGQEMISIREVHQRELELKLEQATEQFGEKTEMIAGLFRSQMEQMIAELGSKVENLSQGSQNVVADTDTPVFDPNAVDTASHWHKQKEAMLSKYGIDPDYRPVMELPETLETIEEEVEESPSYPTLSISEADAAVIEELKEKLNAKLRDAEVELSISRAKISQQQAELEEEQVELDRRAAAIEEKYAAVAKAPKRRMGLFRWLWHHLKPKQPAANDRA